MKLAQLNAKTPNFTPLHTLTHRAALSTALLLVSGPGVLGAGRRG